MSILNSIYIGMGGKEYCYSRKMHKNINNYAIELYAMMGYFAKEDTDMCHSSHPTERLMYSMALSAYIKFGRVKEIG